MHVYKKIILFTANVLIMSHLTIIAMDDPMAVDEARESRKRKRTREGDQQENAGAKPAKRQVKNSINIAEVHARLKQVAEDQGYGYKYANLVELENLVQSFRSKQVVQVPRFVGISNQQVTSALGRVGFDIAAQWRAVVGGLDAASRKAIFASKNIPASFWHAQKIFIQNLNAAFTRLASQENPFNLTKDEVARLQQLFVESADDKLMVRSTGKEDTRTITNAGGNESVPNIEPTMAAVVEAACTVVDSYFDEKSLSQRLGLGDTTIFNEEIFCPILIQRMIREQGDIPSCGVMFTEEAEGGISYRDEVDEHGRIKTSGITLIQAAYGHNEGVVNSKIVVDSYVAQNIGRTPVFYPVIREKTKRLKPAGPDLVFADNPADKIYAPALSHAQLVTLKSFGDALEQYYGYPMDVEFVVRDNTVWIVQARPIVHKEERKTRVPEYFPDLQSIQGTIFKGRTIGAFGGALVSVEHQDECIVNAKISGALTNYQTSDRNKIKCIFSGSDAPATSHEATTFRGEGKPVFYVYDVDALRQAASIGQGKKLIFSPQQHCVVVVDKDTQPATQQGWVSYPFPRELSVRSLIFHARKRGWFRGKLAGRAIDPQSHFNAQELFAHLKSDDLEFVQHAAECLPALLLRFIYRATKQVALDADLKEQMMSIVDAAEILCENLIELCKHNAPAVARLVPINFLEALLYQQQFDAKVGYFSVATLYKAVAREHLPAELDLLIANGITPVCAEGRRQVSSFAASIWGSVQLTLQSIASLFSKKDDETKRYEAIDTRSFYVQLKKLTRYAYSERVKTVWEKFILILAQARGIQKRFIEHLADFIKQLADLEVLPLWLNSSMVHDVEALGQELTFDSCAKRVLQWRLQFETSRADYEFIKVLKKKVHNFDINRFSEPKKFNAAWGEFKDMLLSAFMSDKFMDMLNGAIQEAKTTHSVSLVGAATCGLFDAFIEVFDTSIKAMKGSSAWKTEEKLIAFKTMLLAYSGVLKRVVTDLQEKTILEFKSRSNKTTIQSYLNLIDRLVQKSFSEKDLEPTPGVDATVFAMGSGHDWVQDKDSNKQPASAEDAYTIIHQSLLSCNARFMVACGTQHVIISSLLKDYVDILQQGVQGTENYGGLKQVGLSVDDKKMALIYNFTLGSHGCRITLRQKVAKEAFTMEMNFFGGFPTEAYRWRNAAVIFLCYGCLNNTPVRLHTLHTHALSATLDGLQIKDKDGFVKCFKVILEHVKTDALEYITYKEADNVSFLDVVKMIKILQSMGEYGHNATQYLMQKIKNRMFDISWNGGFGSHTDELIPLLCQAVEGGNSDLNKVVLQIFAYFATCNQALPEALMVALKVVKSSRNDSVLNQAKILLIILFEKGYGIKEFFLSAVDNVPHILTEYCVGDFYSNLIKKKIIPEKKYVNALDEMCQFAYEVFEKESTYFCISSDVKSLVLDLFMILLQNGRGFTEIKKLLKQKNFRFKYELEKLIAHYESST